MKAYKKIVSSMAILVLTLSATHATDVTGDRLNIGGGHTLTGATVSSIAGGTNNTINNASTTAADFIGGGSHNIITSVNSVIGGGVNNSNAANESVIGGGFFNSTAGLYSVIGGGFQNTTAGMYSFIPGGASASTPLFGQMAHASGRFGKSGDSQAAEYVLRSSSAVTNSELFLDGSSLRVVIPTNSARAFEITVVVQDTNGDTAAFRTNGVVKNVAGVISVANDPVFISPYAYDTSHSGFLIELTADQANQSIDVIGLGATTTNRWVARLNTTEVSQ